MAAKEKTRAIAYLRTSSAANVGTDKDSDKRQRAAIEGFGKRAGYELVDEFYDAAVSGADAIDMRPGFAAMLERIEGNGVQTIIVETAYRWDQHRSRPRRRTHRPARTPPAWRLRS
jgi:DNA invertase Pin-like site-specific DNA recombinase